MMSNKGRQKKRASDETANQKRLTSCLSRQRIVELEHHNVIQLHVLLVEPSMAWAVQNLINLIDEMRVHNVHRDELMLRVQGAEIAESHRCVLDRCRQRPPYAR